MIACCTDDRFWRIPEVPLTTFDSCLRLQNGLWQAIRHRVYELTL
jgi:hypothetical protein